MRKHFQIAAKSVHGQVAATDQQPAMLWAGQQCQLRVLNATPSAIHWNTKIILAYTGNPGGSQLQCSLIPTWVSKNQQIGTIRLVELWDY